MHFAQAFCQLGRGELHSIFRVNHLPHHKYTSSRPTWSGVGGPLCRRGRAGDLAVVIVACSLAVCPGSIVMLACFPLMLRCLPSSQPLPSDSTAYCDTWAVSLPASCRPTSLAHAVLVAGKPTFD